MKYKVLGKVHSHDDVSKLRKLDLLRLCHEIREEIIETVASNGGHLASNLGVVELAVALNYVFDTELDSVIYDVSHQCYAHKLITGRYEQFKTLRQYKGLSGFSKIAESKADAFGAGHASTSISAAIGIAKAKALTGDTSKTIAVIGDGALTGGMSFEALNYLGHTKDNVIVIINDNEMSISNNVGALKKVLSDMRISGKYKKLKTSMKNSIEKIPQIGVDINNGLIKSKNMIKQLMYSNMFFEDLGLTYYGVIGGNNIGELIDVLTTLKAVSGPVVLHIKTKKGLGYHHAEKSPENYHGVSPFSVVEGVKSKGLKAKSYSLISSTCLRDLADEFDNVVAITAAMESGTKLSVFKERHPMRFFDVGIAEQHAVTMAAGMASKGIKPYFSVYSTFLQRAYDQLIHDVCLQNLPVTLLLDRCGLVGDDGPTHHGVFDMPYLLSIPNLSIYSPYDEREMAMAIRASYSYDSPVVIRYPRGNAPTDDVGISDDIVDFKYSDANSVVTLLSFGKYTREVLCAIDTLENRGIAVNHLHLVKLKPFDTEAVAKLLSATKYLITIEDSLSALGYGVYFKEKMYELGLDFACTNLGYIEEFIEQGSVDILSKKLGLTSEHIVSLVLDYEKECENA